MCNSKTIKTCQNQHADFVKFLFTEGSQNKKVRGASFRPKFFEEFFGKNFDFVILH